MAAKRRKRSRKKKPLSSVGRRLVVAALCLAGLLLIIREVDLPYDRTSRTEVPAGSMRVLVFFGNSDMEPPESDCSHVFPVDRIIPKTRAVAAETVKSLLAGPTPAEEERGYFTSINSGVTIRSLVIKDGEARVDFNRAFSRGVAGSCKVSAIRAQVTRTLLQFPTVNAVSISVEGDTRTSLQP